MSALRTPSSGSITTSPPQLVAGRQVQPEPPGGLAVELEGRVRPPERVVRRDPDRSAGGVPHDQAEPLAIRRELDVAGRGDHRARAVGGGSAEGLAQDDQPRPLLQQHLDPDLRDQVRDAVHHLLGSERRPADLRDLLERRAPAGRQVHLVADQGHRLRRVQAEAALEGAPGQLGRLEDPEPLLVLGSELHQRAPLRSRTGRRGSAG
jgi:hypothetical protein